MTSWSCSACTFDNKPGVSKCEICGTAAAAVSSNASSCSSSTLPPTRKPKSSKSRQATLLGGFVSKQEEERSVKPKQSKKRSATVASAEVTQQRPSRKIAPAASNNNTASMPCSTVPAHLQVKRNNVKLSELSLESQRVMKEVFGIDKLRNLQPQAIQYALRCQSQLIVMATGGGKSLCYQLPAIVRGGTTIVVSPLKALIADQVNALLKLGISAAFISSSNTASQNREVMERLLLQQQRQPISKQKAATSATAAASSGSQQQQQPITLLYCTPEQIKTDKFRDCLMTMNQENRLAGFAVDEAHCISRYDYVIRVSMVWFLLTHSRMTYSFMVQQ
jgi:DEAD/DEAH box helicase/Zn-finger in Ran binding protein and others